MEQKSEFFKMVCKVSKNASEEYMNKREKMIKEYTQDCYADAKKVIEQQAKNGWRYATFAIKKGLNSGVIGIEVVKMFKKEGFDAHIVYEYPRTCGIQIEW